MPVDQAQAWQRESLLSAAQRCQPAGLSLWKSPRGVFLPISVARTVVTRDMLSKSFPSSFLMSSSRGRVLGGEQCGRACELRGTPVPGGLLGLSSGWSPVSGRVSEP